MANGFLQDLSTAATAFGSGRSFGDVRSSEDQRNLQRQQQFMQLDEQRKGALFQDARTVNSFLKSGQPEQALNVLSQRTSLLEQMGGDTQDTREIADFIARGDIQGATNLLDSVEEAGIGGGFLDDQRLIEAEISKAGGISAEARSFNKMLEDLNPKERELAKRIKLGLAPRAVGSSAQTISQDEQLIEDVASSEASITAAKETAKLQSQFKLKPKISKAVALATAEAGLVGAQNKEAKSNSKALKVYDTAFTTLASALGEAHTGPIVGLMPALTSKAQMADGAVAMVLPTLKSVFREAGEGTFTDGDQKLLTDMAPTRRDNPETIKFKLNAIDAIVRAKLESSTTQAADATQAVDKQDGQIMTDANGNRAMVFPDGSFKEL